MIKKLLNIFKYLAFLGVGVFVFWWVYKDEPLDRYRSAFNNLNYFWIVVSIVFSILSQISRAMRWNMLIRPLGYNPKLYNTFLSVLILYFVNLILPRAGEVFRCTILSRYEKIPFAKLAGTVFVERLADMITLMLLSVVIIISQFGVFYSFFNTHPDVKNNLAGLFSFGEYSPGPRHHCLSGYHRHAAKSLLLKEQSRQKKYTVKKIKTDQAELRFGNQVYFKA